MEVTCMSERFGLWVESGQPAGDGQWQLLQQVEGAVRQWRYGHHPDEETRRSLSSLAGRVRALELKPDDTFVMRLRILLHFWPSRPLPQKPDTAALEGLGKEASQLNDLMVDLMKNAPAAPVHGYLMSQIAETRLLSRCLHEHGRQEVTLSILKQLEVFFAHLSEVYAQVAQEVPDLKSKTIEEIDVLVIERFQANQRKAERPSEAESLHSWYERGFETESLSNPLGRDDVLDAWIKTELVVVIHRLAGTILERSFLTTVIHGRLSDETRESPQGAEIKPWGEAATQELSQRLSNLALSGIQVVNVGQVTFTTKVVRLFSGIIGRTMGQRAMYLTPWLLGPGSLGQWAETFRPLAVRTLSVPPEKAATVDQAVDVTKAHVEKIRQENMGTVGKAALSVPGVSSRFNLLVERLAQVPYYTQTMRELVVRYLLMAF